MITYLCQQCGTPNAVAIDFLDSGTTLTCPACGGETIVDLFRPDLRAEMYRIYEEQRIKRAKKLTDLTHKK